MKLDLNKNGRRWETLIGIGNDCFIMVFCHLICISILQDIRKGVLFRVFIFRLFFSDSDLRKNQQD